MSHAAVALQYARRRRSPFGSTLRLAVAGMLLRLIAERTDITEGGGVERA